MRLRLLISAALTAGVAAQAITLDEVRRRLTEAPCQHGTAQFEVLMPSAAEPVQYTVGLTAVNPGDSLAPCDYLIEWTLPRGGRVSTGFSSYHAGDHFRYRDTRLQEYHYADNSVPFSNAGGGVQRNAQFAELLPAFIAAKIDEMAVDTTFNSTYDERTATLSGVRRKNGYDVLEYSYRFDPQTGLPLQSDFEYNPGSISEQTVTVYYTWDKPDTTTPCPVIDEAYLLERYGEVFEKFRTSTFRVENMRGASMPTFSYGAPGSERQQHTRGEADMTSPVIIVFADAAVASTPATINTVRTVAATLPMSVATLYAFADNTAPEEFAPADGEYTVFSPQGLVRKCGITAYPTFMLVGTDGTVADVIVGTDTDLDTRLEQSMMLLQ